MNGWGTFASIRADMIRTNRRQQMVGALGAVAVCAAMGWVIAQWIGGAMGPGEPAISDRDDPAVQYALAVQEGHCERVMDMTQWIRERIAYVQTTQGNSGAVDEVRDAICAEMQDRPVEQSVLTREGIEDRFAFPPGASLRVVRRDSGRNDLDDAVGHRTWLEVVYPVERYAPRTEHGAFVRSMVVGVNVSPEGMVVKAGVVGNLDVDPASVRIEESVSPGG